MHAGIRIGAVNYLNTKPLIYDLDAIAPEADVRLEVPSRLAQQLAADSLDVALIPVVEYFRADRYAIVPDIAIASHGAVMSVTLFSRKPWAEIKRVALDKGSRTSAALSQIILRLRYAVHPELIALPLEANPENMDADAVLLIGDRAMRACLPGFAFAYDLGKEWQDWVGLPFVYAFWAARKDVELGGTVDALLEAKRRGCSRIGEIAHRQAPGLGLDAGFCRRYLQSIIHFDLHDREIAGLNHFYKLACEAGLVRKGVKLEFLDQPALAESR